MKKRTVLTLLVMVLALTAFAAVNIAGKWTGTLNIQGNETVTYTFNTDGDKLSGNVVYASNTYQLTDGKIKGDSIMFNVNYDGQSIPNTGKCYADSIGLNVDISGELYHVRLKRQ